jgi:hypothetical protein
MKTRNKTKIFSRGTKRKKIYKYKTKKSKGKKSRKIPRKQKF